ncbi:MAG: metallophosphoesterase [Bacteroidota bacterium]|jgi:3',5'-cyclic AMP phosphodiesterase CpdA
MSNTLKIIFLTMKSPLHILTITLLLVIVAMLGGCKKSSSDQPPSPGETFRFVWLADSRGETLEHPINDTVLNAIISKIAALSPKPSFVIFGGDGSYRGYIHPSFMFQTFKDLFAPVTSQGIPLYTAIGNHELYYQHSDTGFLLINQQQFQAVFSENPSNGPASYEHLAYSFTSPGGSCFFATLDPYFLTHDSVPDGLGGNIEGPQMSWLRAQVAKTKAIHKFIFIHTPYYYVSNDTTELSTVSPSFTRLWAFLDSNKFDLYACGHSHLFARRTIDSSVLPNPQTVPQTPAWKNNVVQLINGTCGAGGGGGTVDPGVRVAWNVHDANKTYYFSVFDINGSTVTVNSYGGYKGAYSLIDTFTITR